MFLFITSVDAKGEGLYLEIASYYLILLFIFKSKNLANNVLIYLIIIYNSILFIIIINKILNKWKVLSFIIWIYTCQEYYFHWYFLVCIKYLR